MSKPLPIQETVYGKSIFTTAAVLSNMALVKENDSFEIYSMVLHAPDVADLVKAGQFCMIYLDKGELLLPRPVSFCDVDAENGTVTLVYQVVGAGTKVMAKMVRGRSVKILGPIGNGFFTEKFLEDGDGEEGSKLFECPSLVGLSTEFTPAKDVVVAVAGGGIGVAPLLNLVKILSQDGIQVDVFLGFRKYPILLEEFGKYAKRLFVATDDGSFGHKGSAVDLVKSQQKTYVEFFACGPDPMMRAMAEYAYAQDIPCQVSLEQHMACGVGVCVGCVVDTDTGYQCICKCGPVVYTKGGGEQWLQI